MTPDAWREVKELFHAALAQRPDERDSFLRSQITTSESIRREVERLLAAHEDANRFIESSPMAGVLTADLSGPLTGRTFNHYIVGAVLGSGGMGTVYAARDVLLERTVAVKVVTAGAADAQARLQREAKRASRLNHPGVCTIHDVGTSDGITYVVMEHLEGATLNELISSGPLGRDQVLAYGMQIAEALAHAHDRGVVHNDLKSTNVMVTGDGRVKVLDFGIASDLSRADLQALTQAKTTTKDDAALAGTLAYMAPERLRGEPGDIRSDLWALGVVLFELVAGRRPFHGATGFELSAAILHMVPASLPAEVPVGLQSAIIRSLSKEPKERPASASDVLAELQAIRGIGARPRGNLAAERTTFVGRARELDQFGQELASHRLVTLTGVGGTGKTRIALQLAKRIQHPPRDGVWWVDLSLLSEPERLAETVASALGLQIRGRAPREMLVEFVTSRELLLKVLDNCEHMLSDTADLVDALLTAGEGVRILATSREGLGVAGERMLIVPSLTVPEDGRASADAIASSDATRLFIERAAAVRAEFTIREADRTVLVNICRRVDGIPLAIELAAANARVLSLEQIHDRLTHRLNSLTGRGRAASRHQTLAATLRWSYELLSADEQRLLRVVAIFRGGWTLSAAEVVCGRPGSDTLDTLWRLVEKSLVEVTHKEGAEPRYRLPEMVRQFAFELLEAAGELPEAQQRHASYFLESFEHAVPQLLGPREAETAASLETELDNLHAALHESSEDGGASNERVLRAAADGWPLWIARGHIATGSAVIAGALAHAGAGDSQARARGLMTASMLARFSGKIQLAEQHATASIACHERLGGSDVEGLAFAIFQRAVAWKQMGRTPDTIQAELLRGLEPARQATSKMVLGLNLNSRAILAQEAGHTAEAETLYRGALSTARELESPYLLLLYLFNFAALCATRAEWATCHEITREAVVLLQSSGNRHFAAPALLTVSMLAAAAGDFGGAGRLVGAALSVWAEIGEQPDDDDLRATEKPIQALLTPEYRVLYDQGRAEGKLLDLAAAMQELDAALARLGGHSWPAAV